MSATAPPPASRTRSANNARLARRYGLVSSRPCTLSAYPSASASYESRVSTSQLSATGQTVERSPSCVRKRQALCRQCRRKVSESSGVDSVGSDDVGDQGEPLGGCGTDRRDELTGPAFDAGERVAVDESAVDVHLGARRRNAEDVDDERALPAERAYRLLEGERAAGRPSTEHHDGSVIERRRSNQPIQRVLDDAGQAAR